MKQGVIKLCTKGSLNFYVGFFLKIKQIFWHFLPRVSFQGVFTEKVGEYGRKRKNQTEKNGNTELGVDRGEGIKVRQDICSSIVQESFEARVRV